MPHVTITACNTERQISEINIHVSVRFSRLAWVDRVKCNRKLQEIHEKLEKVVEEYFELNEISTDTYSNHEWNTRMGY